MLTISVELHLVKWIFTIGIAVTIMTSGLLTTNDWMADSMDPNIRGYSINGKLRID